jgi:hypothetical protein
MEQLVNTTRYQNPFELTCIAVPVSCNSALLVVVVAVSVALSESLELLNAEPCAVPFSDPSRGMVAVARSIMLAAVAVDVSDILGERGSGARFGRRRRDKARAGQERKQ